MARTLLAVVATFGVLWASVATGAEREEQHSLPTPPVSRPLLSVSPPPRDHEERDGTEARRPGRPHEIMNACAGANTPSYWMKKLKAEDPQTRAKAAQALGEFRQGEVVPALIRALNDKDRQVLLAVVKALGRIGPRAKGAVPALTRIRQDADPEMRSEVAGALKQIDK